MFLTRGSARHNASVERHRGWDTQQKKGYWGSTETGYPGVSSITYETKWVLLNFYKLQAKTVHKHKTVRMVIVLAFVIRCKNVIYAV